MSGNNTLGNRLPPAANEITLYVTNEYMDTYTSRQVRKIYNEPAKPYGKQHRNALRRAGRK